MDRKDNSTTSIDYKDVVVVTLELFFLLFTLLQGLIGIF